MVRQVEEAIGKYQREFLRESGVKIGKMEVKKKKREGARQVFLTPPMPAVAEQGRLDLKDLSEIAHGIFIVDVALGLGSILFESAPEEAGSAMIESTGDAKVLRDILGN